MNRLKYNIISQKFLATYKDIPLVRTNCKSDIEYNVSIEVFDTDYINSFFKILDLSNLYAILIPDFEDVFLDANLSFISKYNIYDKNIVIAKVEFDFFKNINYNNRNEVSKPFFFRSNAFEELNMNEVLDNCLYEREIGNFKKSVLTIDLLKLLENKEISSIMEFYINRTEAFLEDILHLKENVLDVNEDYISKIEISLE
ncbi:hypothetical protein C8C83_0882 [Flavobacterium sp. 90]|uniref:hypothetical protein n=1 Tax=unclassified Flavobacterium TaxID=196869 RepID=UPI000EB45947|nr:MULTISPECIES: hypothetical protein [unclassified Flavobacterium]RKR09262.1 hypothetical protein C8C82_1182 [Flavobacterium sp. 81]TCK53045.1 hypothetical protein C8C83_0882 [Flavobacterium sp. 90]